MYRFGVDTDCSICASATNRRGYKRCSSGHRFHKGCIHNWYDTRYENRLPLNCPVCRVGMIDHRSNRPVIEEEEEEDEFDMETGVFYNDEELENRVDLINSITNSVNNLLVNLYFEDISRNLTVLVNPNEERVLQAQRNSGRINIDYDEFLRILYDDDWTNIVVN